MTATSWTTGVRGSSTRGGVEISPGVLAVYSPRHLIHRLKGSSIIPARPIANLLWWTSRLRRRGHALM